ncbi:phage integrase SAM-like domain-containing protein [Gramella sp. GC03-9]|uniref:Phage integrase SAM-like domain-containing protein n=1 Tax=Christiangramia oceanisediminis TaxID=2920386 RepID=A0A9X2I0Q6_9FLAO|nr:phage integrase SAM-like domain-containing protein [Gramella oceanisediminis]MCP9198806.1 phage integrase SAM-like domain-containing protein [Gramella oceanisediminis]
MATIKFLLQGNTDPRQIYLRLSLSRGNTPKRKTGLSISSDNWSKKTGLPKTNTAGNKKLKKDLNKLKEFVLEQYDKDYPDGVIIDSKWLKKKINEKFKQSDEEEKNLNIVTAYIDEFLTIAKFKTNSKGGVGLSKSRINDYKSLKRIITEYEIYTGENLLIKNINIPFKNKFMKWMIEIRGYSKGYTGRMLGNLKTICRDAEINDVEVHKQLIKVSGFKVKNEYVIYLTPQELKKIKNKTFNHSYLENAKKWLLLGCGIGQRGNDILNITDKNFVVRNGLKVIELEQQKTGKNVTIPVLPEVEDIIKDGLPHKISLQRFNDYIKEVCKIAEINEVVTGQKIDPDTKRKKVDEYKKWELVTSHICRRSFATNQYGILPTPLIMQITAHSTEKQFYGYIGKNSFDYAQQIADFYAKQQHLKDPKMNVVHNEKKAANS